MQRSPLVAPSRTSDTWVWRSSPRRTCRRFSASPCISADCALRLRRKTRSSGKQDTTGTACHRSVESILRYPVYRRNFLVSNLWMCCCCRPHQNPSPRGCLACRLPGHPVRRLSSSSSRRRRSRRQSPEASPEVLAYPQHRLDIARANREARPDRWRIFYMLDNEARPPSCVCVAAGCI